MFILRDELLSANLFPRNVHQKEASFGLVFFYITVNVSTPDLIVRKD
jgi:hypothetical protein